MLNIQNFANNGNVYSRSSNTVLHYNTDEMPHELNFVDDTEDLVYIHNLYTHITLKRKQFKGYKQHVRERTKRLRKNRTNQLFKTL